MGIIGFHLSKDVFTMPSTTSTTTSCVQNGTESVKNDVDVEVQSEPVDDAQEFNVQEEESEEESKEESKDTYDCLKVLHDDRIWISAILGSAICIAAGVYYWKKTSKRGVWGG